MGVSSHPCICNDAFVYDDAKYVFAPKFIDSAALDYVWRNVITTREAIRDVSNQWVRVRAGLMSDRVKG